MATLYRKYRPQKFDEVVGQGHIKITLQNEIERGEIGHAYLFCGPRGLGKTTLARLFAKAVNCQNRKDGESEPCNKCESCLGVISGSNIDIIEIDAASHTGVDNVRENIIENVRFTPNAVKYKVFIIDEVHMLSIPAFNALLKTLEEPPEHVIFILCTTEIHKLPQTIISRCQRFDLKKISAEEMFGRLLSIVKSEKKKVADEVLKNIIMHSEGCMRDAESLLGKILTLGDDITNEQAELVLPQSDFQSVASFIKYLTEKNCSAGIELINKLIEDGIDLRIFTDSLLEFLRKLLLIKVGGDLTELGIELDDSSLKLAKLLAERLNYESLLSIIELFSEKREEITKASIPQLPLEVAVIQICEEVTCKKDKNDDDFTGTGSNNQEAGDNAGVGGKVKKGLSKMHIKKEKKPEIPLENIEIKKEAVKHRTVKVDMSSKSDKLKPSSFVDIKKVEDAWSQIVEVLLEKNYTLSSLLKMSRPLKVKKGKLEIAVRNNFFKNQLEDKKNCQVVEDIINEVMKANVKIEGVITEGFEQINLEPNNSVASSVEPENIEKPQDVVQDVVGML